MCMTAFADILLSSQLLVWRIDGFLCRLLGRSQLAAIHSFSGESQDNSGYLLCSVYTWPQLSCKLPRPGPLEKHQGKRLPDISAETSSRSGLPRLSRVAAPTQRGLVTTSTVPLCAFAQALGTWNYIYTTCYTTLMSDFAGSLT
jgi:hypothetical protein